jgi:hypothetical protein
MRALLIGDLHLTDRPRDAYRFDIFKWAKQAQVKRDVQATFIMGDICDKKDFHSAFLVNELVDHLRALRPPVYIPMGNHDYTDPTNPFFGFLNFIDGINFVSNPELVDCAGTCVAILPHCTEKLFEINCQAFQADQPSLLLCHQTFDGAIAETGARLTGFSQAPIGFLRPRLGTYAGDVHKPQQHGAVTYVGAPYHIRFGDDFEPRCIYLNDADPPVDLYFDTVRKWSITVRDADEIISNEALLPGDQIKVTVELAREEAVEWQAHKKRVIEVLKRRELEVFGIDSGTPRKQIVPSSAARNPHDVLKAFCLAESVPSQLKRTGETILEESKNG